MHLVAGERETLLLAQELHGDLVLIDERDAHDEATRRGFATFGTLRILAMAAQRSLLLHLQHDPLYDCTARHGAAWAS